MSASAIQPHIMSSLEMDQHDGSNTKSTNVLLQMKLETDATNARNPIRMLKNVTFQIKTITATATCAYTRNNPIHSASNRLLSTCE